MGSTASARGHGEGGEGAPPPMNSTMMRSVVPGRTKKEKGVPRAQMARPPCSATGPSTDQISAQMVLVLVMVMVLGTCT